LTGYEILKDVIEEYRGNKKAGLKTGFTYYDNFSGGLQKSDLVIVAGETSQGKTSFALNIADYIADHKTPVAIISLEMSNGQLLSRLVCSRINLPIKKIRENILSFEGAASDYINLPIYVADIKNNGVNSICGMIRAMVMKHNVEVAVIDYLQLVSDKSKGSREQEIGSIARIFKNLAKELNITVIALSQLARDKNRPYPTLARLRDSGQIEEAADVVIFVYRPEAYGLTDYNGLQAEGLAEVIVAKGRNIGTCKFFLNFRDETTKFSNYDQHQETAPPY
jgi:replicative DNA helicase